MDQIQSALETYFFEWNQWAEQATEYDFSSVRLMHVGWKVPDESALGSEVSQLLQFADQGHIATIHNRKIVLLVLKQPIEGVPVMQIIQRRPGGSEAVGLDHVAFYCKDLKPLLAALAQTDYNWQRLDGPGHQWVSLRFGDGDAREAKFFDRTSLDIAASELEEESAKITA